MIIIRLHIANNHDAGHTDLNATSGALTHRYYVRDYLGSTRAVIDEEGNVLQSTAYYPSGVPLTPNSLTPQTIKLHTGKDYFDLQGAGWYDNQARYYDCLIPTFKSQDPLAEKYPWLSPYNHCANNPMRFVDKDGMRITYTENDIEYTYTNIGDEYGFYDAHGNPYQGESEFINKLTNALNNINTGYIGNLLITSLVNSSEELFIQEDLENSYDHKTNTVNWNPNKDQIGLYYHQGKYKIDGPSFINLAHELVHGYDDINNALNKEIWIVVNNSSYARKSEIRACDIENYIRMEHNIPLRTHYMRYLNNSPIEKSRVLDFSNFIKYNSLLRFFNPPIIK